VVCRPHDVPWHLGMDDDADARVLRADVLDLAHGEARMDRTVSLPQQHPGALDGVRLETAPDLVRIPHRHLVDGHAQLVRGVATEVLIGEKEDRVAALPGPPQRGGGVGRRAYDAAALADERLDRG